MANGGNRAFALQKRQKCQRKGPRLVKMQYSQPFRIQRRRLARVAKAKKLFPRPCEYLRPLVTCCSIKYNRQLREGRGFTVAELQGAKLTPLKARQLRISVDMRRHNKSEESINRNVQRLSDYLSRVIVFSKDATPEEIKKAVQVQNTKFHRTVPAIETAKVADFPKMDVYAEMQKLRNLRPKARYQNEKKRREEKAKK